MRRCCCCFLKTGKTGAAGAATRDEPAAEGRAGEGCAMGAAWRADKGVSKK